MLSSLFNILCAWLNRKLKQVRCWLMILKYLFIFLNPQNFILDLLKVSFIHPFLRILAQNFIYIMSVHLTSVKIFGTDALFL